MNGFALRLSGNAPFVALTDSSLPEEVIEMVRQQCQRMRFTLENLVNAYAASEHTILVEFSPSRKFNAACCSRAQGDMVSLNVGIYVWSYIVSCLIDASAQDAAVREAYEASSFMLDVREYEDADTHALQTVLEEYSAFFTGSKNTDNVLCCITDCIWLHEIAHSLLGHAEFMAEAYGRIDSSLQERPASDRRRLFSSAFVAERRFMEWEADRFAGTLAALSIVERGDTVDDEVEQRLAQLLYGYAILVSAFAAANHATPGAELYPSPLCRFLSFQMGMNIRGSGVGVDFRDLLQEGALARSVRMCFQMLSELGTIFPAVTVFGRFTEADFKEAVVDEYMAIAATIGIGERLSPFRKFNILSDQVP